MHQKYFLVKIFNEITDAFVCSSFISVSRRVFEWIYFRLICFILRNGMRKSQNKGNKPQIIIEK